MQKKSEKRSEWVNRDGSFYETHRHGHPPRTDGRAPDVGTTTVVAPRQSSFPPPSALPDVVVLVDARRPGQGKVVERLFHRPAVHANAVAHYHVPGAVEAVRAVHQHGGVGHLLAGHLPHKVVDRFGLGRLAPAAARDLGGRERSSVALERRLQFCALSILCTSPPPNAYNLLPSSHDYTLT